MSPSERAWEAEASGGTVDLVFGAWRGGPASFEISQDKQGHWVLEPDTPQDRIKTSQTRASESPLSTNAPHLCPEKPQSVPGEMAQMCGVSPQMHAPLGMIRKAEFIKIQPICRWRSQQFAACISGHPVFALEAPRTPVGCDFSQGTRARQRGLSPGLGTWRV